MHPDLEDPAPWAVGLGPGHLAIMFEHVWIKPTNKSTINQLYSQPKHKQPVTYTSTCNALIFYTSPLLTQIEWLFSSSRMLSHSPKQNHCMASVRISSWHSRQMAYNTLWAKLSTFPNRQHRRSIGTKDRLRTHQLDIRWTNTHRIPMQK